MTNIFANFWTQLQNTQLFQTTSRKNRRRRRPTLEILEDRFVPANLGSIGVVPIQLPDVQVNNYQSNIQSSPDIASDAQGNHVVVWHSREQDDAYEPNGWGVYLQRYDEKGNPLETQDILVNTTTKGDQRYPAVAMANDGRFVIVWDAEQKDGGVDARGIYGRRFSANGTPIGNEFRIAAYTQAIASQPDVAMDADGGFVVTWKHDPNHEYDKDSDIHAQRYDKNGNALGYLMIVTPDLGDDVYDQYGPSVAMADDGKFVIAWTRIDGVASNTSDVFARIYAKDGTPLEGRMQINTTTTGGQYLPDVAMDEDGDFVVAWNSYTTSPLEVHARRYFKDPNLDRWDAGNEFRVHEEASSNESVHFAPSVAMDDDGDFTVTWTKSSANDFDVYARKFSLPTSIFNPIGAKGDEFRANNVTFGRQVNSVIAMDDDSDFVIAWNGNGHVCNLLTGLCQGDDNGVFLKRYDVNETPDLSPIANGTVAEGQLLRIYLFASDSDVPNQSLTYSLDQAPAGAHIFRTPGTGLPQFRWTPAAGEAGTYQVTVRVTDNGSPTLSDTETFTIVVTENTQPPALAPITGQTMSRGQGFLKVELHATDPEDNVLTYSAEAVPYDPLYALDQEFDLIQKNRSYYTNWMDKNEKWLWSNSKSKWLYLLPSGELRQSASSNTEDPLVATLDVNVWVDPKLLHEAEPPSGEVPATLAVDGKELFINPDDGFLGTFQVNVTVSDSILSDTGSFLVDVTNSAPKLPGLADMKTSHNKVAGLDITASDTDGDQVTYSVELSIANPLYHLDQTLGLYSTGNYWQDWLGLNEKWLKGTNGWYYLIEGGDLCKGDGELQQHVGSEVWDDPTLLCEAKKNLPVPNGISATIDANDPSAVILLVNPAGHLGEIELLVSASDGDAVSSQSLVISTTNEAPTPLYPEQLQDQQVGSKNTAIMDVTASDADEDVINYSAEVTVANPLYDADQSLGLYSTGNYWQDWLGMNEKWLKGSNGWYYLTKEGDLCKGNSALQQHVGSAVWEDPTLLCDAEERIPAADGAYVTIDDSDPSAVQMTFDPAGNEGVYEITIVADDGMAPISHSFQVTSKKEKTYYGDFNGDGYDDLAVGVPSDNIGVSGDDNGPVSGGAVNVIYGSDDGLHQDEALPNQLWHQDSPGILDIAEVADGFGRALTIGDFNGDGYDDLAVGAPFENLERVDENGDTEYLPDAGGVNVIYGSPDGLNAFYVKSQFWTQDNDGINDTAESYDKFGSALTSGDFNGDGYDDLAIGVPYENYNTLFTDSGATNVIYGSADGLDPFSTPNQLWTTGVQKGGHSGWALAAGDFSGDGYDDLAIGKPHVDTGGDTDAGQVTVVYGSQNGLDSIATTIMQTWSQDSAGIVDQTEAGDNFGHSLAAGDFNDDNYDDLAIGVPYEDIGSIEDAGAVNVIYGGAGGLDATDAPSQFWRQGADGIEDTAETNDRFGWALTAGDFDGKSGDDLAVGVWLESISATANGAGAVNVIYGSKDGLDSDENQFWHQDADGVLDVAESGDRFGGALAVGDYDGDGKADLAVGVAYEDIESAADGTNAGAVNVLYGDGGGLDDEDNQFWHQGVAGILGDPEILDAFGFALGGGRGRSR